MAPSIRTAAPATSTRRADISAISIGWTARPQRLATSTTGCSPFIPTGSTRDRCGAAPWPRKAQLERSLTYESHPVSRLRRFRRLRAHRIVDDGWWEVSLQRIGVVTFPGFHVMSFAALSVFEVANSEFGERRYDVHFISETGGPVRTSAGLMVATEPFDDSVFDTLIIGGSTDPSFTPSEGLLMYLRRAPEISRRVAATCGGAFTLAEAGLLDGKQATTHWDYTRELQLRYPKVKVQEDRIFVIDGSVWTSAGMTATIDLVLAMVERDIDPELAQAVAKKMVIHHRRSGGQSQFSALLQLEPKSDRIQTALAFARKNLHTKLTVEKLAEAAHLSLRQFRRAFAGETGEFAGKSYREPSSRGRAVDVGRQPSSPRDHRAADRLRGSRKNAAGIRARIRPATPSDAATGSKGRPTGPRRPVRVAALRNADLMVSPEAATLQGNASSADSRSASCLRTRRRLIVSGMVEQEAGWQVTGGRSRP